MSTTHSIVSGSIRNFCQGREGSEGGGCGGGEVGLITKYDSSYFEGFMRTRQWRFRCSPQNEIFRNVMYGVVNCVFERSHLISSTNTRHEV